LAAMIYSGATGAGFWLPMKNIAALWLGVYALVGGTGVVCLGILTHLVIAGGLGILFAMTTPRRAKSAAAGLIGGLLFGGATWLVMTFVLMPMLDPTMRARIAFTPGWWFVLHMIFGASLILIPLIRLGFSRVPAGQPAQMQTA
ncbi:MAG: hypothetical protein ACRD4K_16515, partial [Candidatus Acidiferrales bacterium]